MFENIITNLKTSSTRISESLSVESLKQKTGKFTETLDNLKCSVMNKTNSLSSYLSEIAYNRDGPAKTISTPNLNESSCPSRNRPVLELKWPVLVDNKMEWVNYQSYSDDESDSVEPDIVDKFARVAYSGENDYYSYRTAKAYRRNDREEIRRRLATGSDVDEYYGGDRPGRKPSLQARLQSGMNLQICFMNETMSDSESPCSEVPPPTNIPPPAKPKTINQGQETPRTINVANKNTQLQGEIQTANEGSFFERQARLQAEARVALAQAKDLARMQMQAERQRHQTSPITDMLRASLHKVGIAFPEGRRRVSRQMLTDMNVAQLQVIVNDLHTQIEQLNEDLVKYLMERDELHMSQDSMLVDIEDLTRYLGAKENMIKEEMTHNNNVTQTKPMISRIVNLGKK